MFFYTNNIFQLYNYSIYIQDIKQYISNIWNLKENVILITKKKNLICKDALAFVFSNYKEFQFSISIFS